MGLDIKNPAILSGTTLAFVGDSVYGLYVREKLCQIDRPSGALHSESVKFVNAAAQAKAYLIIKDLLSEKESDIFKRGRNAHTSTTPKNSSSADYHTATGLEALFGFLHLGGQDERARELFEIIWQSENV